MIWYVVTTILFALAGMIIYVYFLKKGQFDNLEETKYQVFREEEEK